MAVPRAVLEQAATIAEADPNEFVQSRGEILRNFMSGMPEEDESTTSRPVDTARSKTAVAYLDKLGVGVSTEALRGAARDGNAEIVKACSMRRGDDTGVSKLDRADSGARIGCSSGERDDGGDTAPLREGARPHHRDDNPTGLLFAADECGPRRSPGYRGRREGRQRNGSG